MKFHTYVYFVLTFELICISIALCIHRHLINLFIGSNIIAYQYTTHFLLCTGMINKWKLPIMPSSGGCGALCKLRPRTLSAPITPFFYTTTHSLNKIPLLLAMISFPVFVSLALVPFTFAQSTDDAGLQIAGVQANFQSALLVPQLLPTFSPSAALAVSFEGVGNTASGTPLTQDRRDILQLCR